LPLVDVGGLLWTAAAAVPTLGVSVAILDNAGLRFAARVPEQY